MRGRWSKLVTPRHAPMPTRSGWASTPRWATSAWPPGMS